jgi:hypothetical protein
VYLIAEMLDRQPADVQDRPGSAPGELRLPAAGRTR